MKFQRMMLALLLLSILTAGCAGKDESASLPTPEGTLVWMPEPDLANIATVSEGPLNITIEAANVYLDARKLYKEMETFPILNISISFENASQTTLTLKKPFDASVASINTNTYIDFEFLDGELVRINPHGAFVYENPNYVLTLDDFVALQPGEKLVMNCEVTVPFANLKKDGDAIPLPAGTYNVYVRYVNLWSGFRPDPEERNYYLEVNAWTGLFESSRITVEFPAIGVSKYPVGNFAKSWCEYALE